MNGNFPDVPDNISETSLLQLIRDTLEGNANQERERRKNYETYWNIYNGITRTWLKTVDVENPIYINYGRALIDRSVGFIIGSEGKGLKVKARLGEEQVVDQETAEKLDKINNIINSIFRRLERDRLLQRAYQTGFVTGDVFLKPYIVERNGQPWRIDVMLYDPSFCQVIYATNDIDDLEEVEITYPVVRRSFLSSVKSPLKELNKESKKMLFRREIYTKELIYVEEDGKKVLEKQHNYQEVPIVHIRNMEVAGKWYGMSDLKDIKPILEELSYKATELRDILNYHAKPFLLVINAGEDLVLDRKATSALYLPQESDVRYVQLPTMGAEHESFIEFLLTALHEITAVPKGMLGEIRDVSNLTGSALSWRYQALESKMANKKACYAAGFGRLARLMLKACHYSGIHRIDESWLKDIYFDVEFPSPYPKNEYNQLNLDIQKINAGLESRLAVLKREGMTEEEALKELERISKENAEIARAEQPWVNLYEGLGETSTSSEEETETEDEE